MNRDSFDDFTIGYIVYALWSSTDDAIEEGGLPHPDSNGGWPLDDNYSIDDIDDESLAKMVKDCADFQEANAADLEESELDKGRQGHDFWLTRNGHGAGFWDEGIGEVGDRLSDAAHAFRSVNLYVYEDATGTKKIGAE